MKYQKPKQANGTKVELVISAEEKMKSKSIKPIKGLALCLTIIHLLSVSPAMAMDAQKLPSQKADLSKVQIATTKSQAVTSADLQKLRQKNSEQTQVGSSTAESSASSIENSAGGFNGGGGDPRLIKAISYPDLAGLDRAIELVQTSLTSSQYSDEFKGRINDEILSLKNCDKFKMLPYLIILGPGMGPEGYALPNDAGSFIALGATTDFKIGATVFMAERLQKYNTEDLANVILHEAIHHVMPLALSEDEDFVRDLSNSIISKAGTRALSLAMEQGIYVQPKRVSLGQLINALDFDLMTHRILHKRLNSKRDLIADLSKSLLGNLSTTPAWVVREEIFNSLIYYNDRESEILTKYDISMALANLAHSINSSVDLIPITKPSVYGTNWGCKREVSFLDELIRKGCRPDEELLMKDFFENIE